MFYFPLRDWGEVSVFALSPVYNLRGRFATGHTFLKSTGFPENTAVNGANLVKRGRTYGGQGETARLEVRFITIEIYYGSRNDKSAGIDNSIITSRKVAL
jgi:hypothetical protein